jgi:FUN14 domain-containing protein 1
MSLAPIPKNKFILDAHSGPIDSGEYPSPPQSSLSVYELSFGAVTGICAGVFIKKGAKAVAWFIGGIFVLLQVCCDYEYRSV